METTQTASEGVKVQEVAPPRTKILPFACSIPSDMSFVPNDPDSLRKPLPPVANAGMPHQQEQGIVGTITFMGKKSIMVWFGWGSILPSPSPQPAADDQQPDESQTANSVGTATNLNMGPLVVGMPRNTYRGAFSDEQASVSKLVGSSDDAGGGIQNTRIASQLADRLSQRLKIAVFCSCNLEGPNTPILPGGEGTMEQQMLRSRAGALAEREIGRVLAKSCGRSNES